MLSARLVISWPHRITPLACMQSDEQVLHDLVVLKLGLPVLQIDGKVTYNGHTFNDFLAQRTAAYVEQEDQHM